MTGPLDGVRIVDFSAVIAGPLATMWLADMGAEVIKVEAPGRADTTRGLTTTPDLGGLAGLYVNCNRGKRSLCVDASTAAGRQIILDLCAEADVFVQNWRPGAMRRLGLSYEDLRDVRRDIVYASISGYGSDGPYQNRRAYDPVIQGLSGYVDLQTNPDIPFPDLVRTAVCDKATSLVVTQAVCAALYARERSGDGQEIEVPMLDSSIAFLFPDAYMVKSLLDDPARDERGTLAMGYRVRPTADGQLIYHTATWDEEMALFRALGHPEWREDQRFSTPAERQQNRADLGALIADAIESTSTADLLVRFQAEGVPCAPINNLEEVLDDPQVVHNGVFGVREHPKIGRVLEVRSPARFHGNELGETCLAPALGEHTREILEELGRSEEEIGQLVADGAVALPNE